MTIEKIREGLYIKKSFDGYRVVYPIKNEDGTINWFNIWTGGNYWNLLKTIILLLLILGITYSYYRDIKLCKDLIENPCSYLLNITNFCYNQEYDLQDFDFEGVIINDSET